VHIIFSPIKSEINKKPIIFERFQLSKKLFLSGIRKESRLKLQRAILPRLL
jgi:hypothetical protein